LAASILSSCATIPDTPICAEINPSKGYCVYTLSDKEFVIDDDHLYEGKTFWEMRPLMVMLPPSSWAKIKAFILKICKQTQQCNQQYRDVEMWVNGFEPRSYL